MQIDAEYLNCDLAVALVCFTTIYDWLTKLPPRWDGAVVRTLSSHQCGLGSILGLGVTSLLSLILVLVLGKVFLMALLFSYLLKTNFSQKARD